jgi:hypothetical protein
MQQQRGQRVVLHRAQPPVVQVVDHTGEPVHEFTTRTKWGRTLAASVSPSNRM